MALPAPKSIQTISEYPDWVVLHIPHDSTLIPEDILNHFCITNDELNKEKKVQSITIEVNRSLYVNEATGEIIESANSFICSFQKAISNVIPLY